MSCNIPDLDKMMKQVKASISALLYLWNALKISSYSMVGVSADLIFTNFLQTITLHRWFFFRENGKYRQWHHHRGRCNGSGCHWSKPVMPPMGTILHLIAYSNEGQFWPVQFCPIFCCPRKKIALWF